ncbi:hypothetical protein [Lyngbya aestuarii]|uniref:hypothetical protein n=1 Tax=Lyngbya aestuarii TaxID=118322 RepID=UPI00403DD7A9
MNFKYLAPLTAILLTTGFGQQVTQAQSSQLATDSQVNNTHLPHFQLSFNRQTYSVPAPPDSLGSPDHREPAGARAVQSPRKLASIAL